MRYVLLLFVLLFQISAAPRVQSQDTYQPPQSIQLRWLETGQLLVQWQQQSQVDKVTVMWCRAYNPDICKPYLEVFNRLPGPRYAIIPTEPGAVIRFAEWRSENGTFKLLSWEPGTAAPQYGTLLPVIATP